MRSYRPAVAYCCVLSACSNSSTTFLVVYSSPLEISVVREKVTRGHVKATPPRLQTRHSTSASSSLLSSSSVSYSDFLLLEVTLISFPPPLSLSLIPSPVLFPICALHCQFPLALLAPSDRRRATCFHRSPLLPSVAISQQDAGSRSLALSISRRATWSWRPSFRPYLSV